MALIPTAGMKRHGVLALGVLLGCAASAWGAADIAGSSSFVAPPVSLTADAAERVDEYDIPAQALEAALIRYGVVSGHPALFPSAIVAGRISSPLQGMYSAETALRRLLADTGLTIERRDSDLGETYILKEAGAAAAADAASASMAVLFHDQGYPGLVQTRIWQALCADARTAPGRYRSLFRFRVDAGGRVNAARLLQSSGDATRDAAILEILQHVQIDRAPPSALVQHRLAMLVLPDDAHAGSPCAREGQGG